MNAADLRSAPAAVHVTAAPSAVVSASSVSTASPRDPALDLLRSVALVRVVLWHAFAATWMMSFAAMPVMFFVAGTLLPGRAGIADTARVLLRRARRILVPLWIYAATVAVVLVIAGVRPGWGDVRGFVWWIVPLGDPPAADFHAGWLSNHLWYLRAYLWLLLLSPVLQVLAKRVRLTLLGGAVLIALLDWLPSWSWHVPVVRSGTGRIIVGDIVAYGLFAVLGIAYGRHRRASQATASVSAGVAAQVPGLPRWAMVAMSAACATGTVLFATVRGLPTGGINASYPAIVLCGLAWLFGVGAIEPALRRFAVRPAIAARSRIVSSRALTIYLWHPAAIVVARSRIDGDGPISWIGITAVTAALTALAVIGVGWVEDLAARRRPHRSHLPAQRPLVRPMARIGAARRAGINGAFLVAAVAGLTTCMPALVPSGAVTGDDPIASGPVGGQERREILPPSFRDALGDDAFGAPPPSDAAAPATPEVGAAAVPAAPIEPAPAPTAATPSSALTSSSPTPPVPSASVVDPIGPSATVVAPSSGDGPASVDAASALVGNDATLRAALDAWHLAHPTLNTLTVSVAADGQRWQGDSNLGRIAAAFGVRDTFPIASLTKTFTLALVLREVEQGRIELDAPVPPLPGIGDLNASLGITPRQLLQHASGLVNYTNADDFTVRNLSPADAVSISLRTPLRSAPGTKVHYANTNYLYLGLLVEHVTGRPYEDLVAEMVGPLGLSQSAVDVVRGKGWVGFSSGGMSSSVTDLAAWLDALYTPGRVLAPTSIEAISTLTDVKLAAGMWPICPCWVDPATGERGYTAIGHQAEFGAINRYPKAGISVAVRIDPPSPEAGALAADLGRELAAAVAPRAA